MNYHKLVRDKIIELFPCTTSHIAESDDEYWQKLKEKLREEVEEFITGENEEEVADIQEVLDAIYEFKHFSKKNIEIIQKKKAEERGGFTKRIILDTAEK